MTDSSLLLSAIMPHSPARPSDQLRFTTPRQLRYPEAEMSVHSNISQRNRRQTISDRFDLPEAHDDYGPSRKGRASLQVSQSTDSDGAESEVSVTKLKGWLDDFGQQHKNHHQKMNKVGQAPAGVPLQKVTRNKFQVQQKQTKQQVRPIKRSTDHMKESRKGPTMTPVRFKTRGNDKVKATDDGYASVKQLSAWLADDPTTSKATRGCVRRGINVIHKSRMFEKDLEDVIVEEVGLDHGAVKGKKQWLEHAFEETKDQDFDRQSAVTELVSVKDKKKWLDGAFGAERRVGGSVFEPRDDRSCLSVNDKRDWLQSAFKKGSERMLTASTDDSATPAKQKWKARVARRRSDQQGGLKSSRAAAASTRSPRKSVGPTFANKLIPQPPSPLAAREPHEPSAKPCPESPPQQLRKRCDASGDQNRQSQPSATSQPLGFKVARQLLVKRSEQNGNPVAVLTKVQMRKNKFERWERDQMKGTGPKGLLKPSWEQSEGNNLPITEYSKTFVEDIAPTRSFDELP